MKDTNKNISTTRQLLLSATSAAALCGISPDTLRRLADAGSAPRPLRLGRAVRWRRADIEVWVEAGCPSVASRPGCRVRRVR